MGGLACWARFSALVPFSSIPTAPDQMALFDKGMRQFWASSETPESLVAQLSLKSVPPALNETMQKLCSTLAKPSWNQTDRQFLMDTAESLYE